MTTPTPLPHWKRAAAHYAQLLHLTQAIPLPEAKRVLWEAIRQAAAGMHEIDLVHVVEGYELCVEKK
jgi:hypothetical protein